MIVFQIVVTWSYVHNLDLENKKQYFNGADVGKWVKLYFYFGKSAQVSTW